MLLVCEATRRHVTVALVGDGGDEAFGGYERYRAHALAGRVPRFAAALGTAALGAVPAARREPRSTLFRARRFLDVAAQPAPERYARLVEVFPLELRRELWTDEAHAHAARTMLPDDPDLRIVDIESYLPGDLLPKSDLASMAVSLELRAPFLDHHVIELGLALPPELARGKRALKEAFAADLPPEIAGRAKTGFGVPLDEWFRGPLRGRRTSCCSAARPRALPTPSARAAAARARRAARRPRAPALVPLHARAVAAALRGRRRAGARRRLSGGEPALPAKAEPVAVDLLGALGAAHLGEALDRAPARLAAHRRGARRVGRELEHRRRERVGVAGRHEQAGLAVAHEVLEPADRRCDHGPRALHRLERDHAEALAERRHDDRERLLDRALHRRDVAEEPARSR